MTNNELFTAVVQDPTTEKTTTVTAETEEELSEKVNDLLESIFPEQN